MKHAKEITIHTTFPVSLCIAFLVQNDISASMYPNNASVPTTAKRKANIAAQIRKNNLYFITLLESIHLTYWEA